MTPQESPEARSSGRDTSVPTTPVNVTLTVGFASVAAAALAAHGEPATAYEPSIYTGTPTMTWFTLVIAFSIALGVTLACTGPHRVAGIGLGALSSLVITGLPVIRSYRFHGKADAMTHLGWAQDIVAGEIAPHDIYYPAVHGLSALVYLLGGIPLDRAMMLVVLVLFVPFLVFVPLVARQITGHSLAVGIAAIVAWFILPVNNIATHFGLHTNTNALFFVPVVLFAAIAYLRRDHDRERLLGLSPYSLLLYAVGIGILFLHPQHMINAVLVLGAIALVQRSAAPEDDGPIPQHTSTYGHTVVLAALFLLWSLGNERFRSAFLSMLTGLFTGSIGAGAEVEQRGASLTELGGSLPALFVTMFGEAAIIGVLVGLFVLGALVGHTRWDRETTSHVTYMAVGTIPIGILFLLYFFGTPTMAFRQLGFIYVLVTVLAGAAIASVMLWTLGRLPSGTTHATIALLLAVCLALSLVTVFASPIIYNPNQQVTDATMSGYETALEGGNGENPYVGLGYGVHRYDDAIYGVESDREDAVVIERVVDVEAFEDGNYSGAAEADTYYFAVSTYDETREFTVFAELHHTRTALETLEEYPGSARAVSSEEFRLYEITSADD